MFRGKRIKLLCVASRLLNIVLPYKVVLTYGMTPTKNNILKYGHLSELYFSLMLFVLLSLAFESVNEILDITIQAKATEQCFQMML